MVKILFPSVSDRISTYPTLQFAQYLVKNLVPSFERFLEIPALQHSGMLRGTRVQRV